MKKIMVLIPAYNEENNLPAVLANLLQLKAAEDFDIVVVDDHSKDNTAKIARSYGCKVITHILNMGYGMGLQTGYKYAAEQGYDYVLQMDADGQHSISNVANLCQRVQSGNPTDLLLGSRFLPESTKYPMGFVRRTAIRLFSAIIRMKTGKIITDPTSGLQLLSRPLFTYYAGYGNFDPQYPDANMLIKILLKGFCVEEFPAVMTVRTEGESMHSGLKPVLYMIQMAISMMVVSFRAKNEGKYEKK